MVAHDPVISSHIGRCTWKDSSTPIHSVPCWSHSASLFLCQSLTLVASFLPHKLDKEAAYARRKQQLWGRNSAQRRGYRRQSAAGWDGSDFQKTPESHPPVGPKAELHELRGLWITWRTLLLFNEHVLMILFNSLMRKPGRCYDNFKGESKEETQL